MAPTALLLNVGKPIFFSFPITALIINATVFLHRAEQGWWRVLWSRCWFTSLYFWWYGIMAFSQQPAPKSINFIWHKTIRFVSQEEVKWFMAFATHCSFAPWSPPGVFVVCLCMATVYRLDSFRSFIERKFPLWRFFENYEPSRDFFLCMYSQRQEL